MRSTSARFATVGLVNTALDLVVFAVLSSAGMGVLGANTLSTSAGMAFSFAANRRFTFRSGAPARATIVPFLAVTLVCLWVIHPLVILAVSSALEQVGTQASSAVLAGKVAAIMVGMGWNYAWYHHVVFADGPREQG